MISDDDLPAEIRERGFHLPRAYIRLGELGLTNLEPWYFLHGKEFEVVCRGLNGRYPKRVAVPYARRKDNDDVACFVVQSGDHEAGSIIIVHDYSSPGHEVDFHADSFWDWFRVAIDDMIAWT